MTSKNNIELLDGERFDDLQYNGLEIIQNENLYCFSSDAVLLCNFVKANKNDTIVDLCSGSGVVGILSQAKTNAKNLIMIEKQSAMADMCNRSIKLNNLRNAKVVCADITDAVYIVGSGKADVVCSNPPYYLTSQKKLSGNKQIDMAKFELEMTFETLCNVTSKILKFGGRFYTINDSCRIPELMETMRMYKLEPKKLEFIFTKANKSSTVVLIEAVKNGRRGAKVFYRKNI